MDQENGEDNEITFKIIVLGNSSVGKTSLIHRYVDSNFSTEYKATIGVDFSSKAIRWEHNLQIRLHVWDMAGQERWGTLINSHYRNTDGVFCVLDMSKPDTAEGCRKWSEAARAKCTSIDGEINNPPIICLGNKYDLFRTAIKDEFSSDTSEFALDESVKTDSLLRDEEDKEEEDLVKIELDPKAIKFKVDTKDFQVWAKQCDYTDGFLVSALTSEGIDEAFHALIKIMLERHRKEEALEKLNGDIEKAKSGIFKLDRNHHAPSYTERIYSTFTNC